MEIELKKKIGDIISSGKLSAIIEADEFYFLKAKNSLEAIKKCKFNEEERLNLLNNRKEYNILKELFENDSQFMSFGHDVFSLITYCDAKAHRKNQLNKYDDKRVLALAYVRMNNWVDQIISFKFGEPLQDGSIKNAIEYLERPIDNFTMLSENHRKQISENLFMKDYNKNNFKQDFIDYFSELSIVVKNPENYTHLLSRIAYFINSDWEKSLIGLMACDTTGWQSEKAKGHDETNYITPWNHRKPSGTDSTLALLKKCIEENGHFKIFYSLSRQVKYVAEVIDFATNQQELTQKGWGKLYSGITWYSTNFTDYKDSNKSASIIYLASKFYPVESTPENQFKYLHPYKYPSVGSQTPVVSYNTNLQIQERIIMENNINLLKYKKQIILQGPPGTGKTKLAQEIAEKLISFNEINKGTTSIKQLSREFIKKNLKVGQKLESKNKKEFEIISLDKSVVIIKSETSKPWRPSYDKIIDSFNNQSWLVKGRSGGYTSYEDAIARYFYETHLSSIESSEQQLQSEVDFSVIIQFHPSYTYEDFVRGIVAKTSDTEEGIVYVAENKILVEFSERALNDPENNYILIIDEINRANLSSVLGELIYALEYRGKAIESMYAVNNDKKVIIPPNLYIVGTMNTADRSVGHIDYAIRRRFAFIEVLPEKLQDSEELYFNTTGFEKVAALFAEGNVSPDFDRKDVQIGHSYFIAKKTDADSEQKRDEIFEMKMKFEVVPILFEYVKDGILTGDDIKKKIEALITSA